MTLVCVYNAKGRVSRKTGGKYELFDQTIKEKGDLLILTILPATAMIWCGLLSIPFLGRRLKWFQWFGMFVIACGLFLKASIMIPGMFDYEEPVSLLINTLIKMILSRNFV